MASTYPHEKRPASTLSAFETAEQRDIRVRREDQLDIDPNAPFPTPKGKLP